MKPSTKQTTKDDAGLSLRQQAEVALELLRAGAAELQAKADEAGSHLEALRQERMEAAKREALGRDGAKDGGLGKLGAAIDTAAVRVEALRQLIAENDEAIAGAAVVLNDAFVAERREVPRVEIAAAQTEADQAAGEVRASFRILALAQGALSVAGYKLARLDLPAARELALRTSSDALAAELLESGCKAVALPPDAPGSDGCVCPAVVVTPPSFVGKDVLTLTVEQVVRESEQVKRVVEPAAAGSVGAPAAKPA